jgi:hypothetical protein
MTQTLVDPAAAGVVSPTPVLGTAQPQGGLVGAVRRLAYTRPAHDPSHWLLLLAADRLSVGGWLGHASLVPGEQPLVVRHFARQARSYPRQFVAAGALLGLGLLLRWRR